MPLVKSSSKKAMGENYDKLKKEGYPKKQRTAIMLDVARKAGAKIPKKKKKKY